MMQNRRAVIIGAGPAGLTAAYELLARAGIQVTVLEQSQHLGGISRTVNYKGNRIDIGGHRFFSKSDRVMQWWLRMLPLEAPGSGSADGGAPHEDRVMLVRQRKSRIYFLRRFFDYPISLSADTLRKLGAWRVLRIGASYLASVLFPLGEERTLEQFFINRFGKELYRTFFRSYTEKVWGVPCHSIPSEWGAQRVKGLSVRATLAHALRTAFRKRPRDLDQKGTETSLIEQFLYPKLGPGQMWEEVARRVREMGGEVRTGWRVEAVETDGWRVVSVRARHLATGATETFTGDFFFSTAPIRELMRAFSTPPPQAVLDVSDGLVYRDFITVGLLVNRLKVREGNGESSQPIGDNWIYIQEPDVQLGRLQIFNNWSPYMVADPRRVWLGLEYFCNQSDPIWNLSDPEMTTLAIEELSRIGIVDSADVLDATVLRMEKAYPAYFGTYERFGVIRDYVDRYRNLFLVGRNGMHRYNNQDHSMLTAMIAVENIVSGTLDKSNLWEVNTETGYHEGRSNSP